MFPEVYFPISASLAQQYDYPWLHKTVLSAKCRLFWYSWPSASIKDAIQTYVKWHIPVDMYACIPFLSFVISRLPLMPKTMKWLLSVLFRGMYCKKKNDVQHVC